MSKPKFLKKPPSKIVCVGLNYVDHAKELNMPIPDEPLIFLKPPTALIGPEENIIYPETSKWIEYEAELGIVIKKECKNVSKENAMDYVEGFTCVNDVTARDLQKKDGQWIRAKGFDTFCPVGPKVVKDIDPHNIKVECYLNGELKQSSSTKNFVFSVEEIISFISKVMTLNSGDIIATGTPPGVGPMQKGDTVEVKIEGIGSLVNHVK